MKLTITTKKCDGEIQEMENLLYYWYILGLCVRDIRYEEWWERGTNPAYVKIDKCKELQNQLIM